MFTDSIKGYRVAGCCVLLLVAGCGQSDTESSGEQDFDVTAAAAHDSDDVHITADDVERPKNYAAAVDRIKAYRNTIRDEIAAGRPSKAHRPLDEASYVLEWLPEIVQESGIAKEHWEQINVSAQTIRESFDQVHARIDNQQEPEFQAIGADVQQAIGALEAAMAAGTPAKSLDENESGSKQDTPGATP